MTVLLENASELEVIAREIGAISLKGHLRYPSESGVPACEAALR